MAVIVLTTVLHYFSQIFDIEPRIYSCYLTVHPTFTHVLRIYLATLFDELRFMSLTHYTIFYHFDFI